MAKRIDVNIELESGLVISKYKSIKLEQDLFNHHTFEIVTPFEHLENPEHRSFHEAHEKVLGKQITFTFKPIERDGSVVFGSSTKGKNEFVFKGIVTSMSLKNTSDLVNVFVIKGHSNTILLDDGVRNRWLPDDDLRGHVEKVLAPYPSNVLKRKIQTNEAYFLPTPQYQESNFQYLNRLAFLAFQWCYYNGTELIFGQDEGKEATFTVDGVQTFEMSLNLTWMSFDMKHFDPMRSETYESKSASAQAAAAGPLGDFVSQQAETLFSQPSQVPVQVPVNDSSMLDVIVSRTKRAKAGDQIKFKGRGEYPNVNIGSIVSVQALVIRDGKESFEDFGKFRVISITHDVTQSGNYSNEFEAIPYQQDTPIENPYYANLDKFPVCYSDRAKVIDNNDPKKEGRVRVQFTNWMAESGCDVSPWIPVSTPYAGKERGFLFIPEVDEEVLVGYIHGACSFPYVMCSQYTETANIDYTSDEKNNFKTIATRGGNRIYFSDEEGEQMIVLTNILAQETLISLYFKDGGNKIRIKTGDSNGEISIESANKLVINTKTLDIDASDAINIKGKSLNIETQQAVEIKANQGITLKSSTGVTIDAKTAVEVKSTASLKLDAAMLEAKATGIFSIQGSLVKIN
jgi:type VI secretion system secreted protein VgrG